MIIRKELPRSRQRRVDELVRAGRLHRVLPGIYSPSEALTWHDRVWAVQAARPEGVLTGPTAARLTFWPDHRIDDIWVAGARFRRGCPQWVRQTTRSVPSDMVRGSGTLRWTSTPLTVLDLVEVDGGNAIDEALRRRATTLDRLHETLAALPGRHGNTEVRRLLSDSRDQPWSFLERQAHRGLRRHRIGDWQANHRVRVRGRTFYIDIAFPHQMLAVEIDGWSAHRTREVMDNDAVRHNLLVLAGWMVLRFTERNLGDLPESVRQAEKLQRRR
ncbi:DUF559 domain-containing protein [Propionibacteriaceae bacterium Y1814]